MHVYASFLPNFDACINVHLHVHKGIKLKKKIDTKEQSTNAGENS